MARKPKLPRATDFFGGGGSEEAKPTEGKAVKPQYRQAAEEVPDTAPAQASPAHAIEAGLREKVTFYLSRDLLKRLELTKVQLLLDHDLKVSRSQIVEVIVEQTLEDVERIAPLLESVTET